MTKHDKYRINRAIPQLHKRARLTTLSVPRLSVHRCEGCCDSDWEILAEGLKKFHWRFVFRRINDFISLRKLIKLYGKRTVSLLSMKAYVLKIVVVWSFSASIIKCISVCFSCYAENIMLWRNIASACVLCKVKRKRYFSSAQRRLQLQAAGSALWNN